MKIAKFKLSSLFCVLISKYDIRIESLIYIGN